MLKLSSLKAILFGFKHRAPRGLGLIGNDTTLIRPHWITGRENIYIGARTFINRWATLNTEDDVFGPDQPARLTIGDDVYIGPSVWINCVQEVTIGDDCLLSEQVYINDGSHGIHPGKGPVRWQPSEIKGPVRIGAHCFLGFRCCILPGVILGESCVVGVNAVVTRSFPAYSMLVGSPAKCIKRFSFEADEWIKVVEDEA